MQIFIWFLSVGKLQVAFWWPNDASSTLTAQFSLNFHLSAVINADINRLANREYWLINKVCAALFQPWKKNLPPDSTSISFSVFSFTFILKDYLNHTLGWSLDFLYLYIFPAPLSDFMSEHEILMKNIFLYAHC